MGNKRKISELGNEGIATIANGDLYYVLQGGEVKSCTHAILKSTAISRLGLAVSIVSISAAQVQTLNSVGKVLVSSGDQYVPYVVIINYLHGGSSYTGTNNIYINYGSAVTGQVNFSTGSSKTFIFYPSIGNFDSTEDIMLKCDTDPINGNGTMIATIIYNDV